MNHGKATFKLPFPNIVEKTQSRHRRVWAQPGQHIPEAKFYDTCNSRPNWKRFKNLCRSLKASKLDYNVTFHFEELCFQRSRYSEVQKVWGLRAEICWCERKSVQPASDILTAERMLELARRISRHPPPISRPIDSKLLVGTARRLRQTPELVSAMPCSDIVN